MRIILAYSGGLDTSVALHWLEQRYRADVIAFCADIGQSESLAQVRRRAEAAGAAEVRIEDLTDRYLRSFALPALQAHARYEEKYLLAAPLSRPLIAARMVELAAELGADAVAHGATGKGNDQVRFYTSVRALNPSLQVIAPVLEWELRSRQDEIDYAERHGIELGVSGKSPYSVDTNIWGTSIECGQLDDVTLPPPADAWQWTRHPAEAPDHPVRVTIGFEHGVPVALDGQAMDLTDLVKRLNTIAGAHGVGRIDIVENRIVGFKTRGIYEAPAATVLMRAHSELEELVLDRETLHYKRGLAARYGELVYYGYWFSDLRAAFDAFVGSLQVRMDGEVTLELFKGNCTVLSRASTRSRYSRNLASYESEDVFDHSAGGPFAYVWALPLVDHHDSSATRAEGSSNRPAVNKEIGR